MDQQYVQTELEVALARALVQRDTMIKAMSERIKALEEELKRENDQ